MIDKAVATPEEAVRDLQTGSVVLVSGFGEAGVPLELVEAVLMTGATDLTIVANNAGTSERGISALLRENRVRRIICSYPRFKGSIWFERRYAAGDVELEVVPQGTLSERIRAGGAGIGAFFTPTAAGTQLGEGKETRLLSGVTQVLEFPIRGDVALVKAHLADRWGNLTYRLAARNYAPTMAMAAGTTIAQVDRVVELGSLDPDSVVTPSIFVDRVVTVSSTRNSDDGST